MIQYKARLAGITVIVTEESYTSRASFIDRDEMIPNRPQNQNSAASGIKRGLYHAKDGTLINADCNGSYNIMRKVAPDAFGSEGVEDGKRGVPLVVHPVRLSFPSRSQKASNGVSKQSRER
jgi:putative transposase